MAKIPSKLKPLTIEELEIQLDYYLEPVLSKRRTSTEAAQRLSKLDRDQQDMVLRWVAAISPTNIELAYHFALESQYAFDLMNDNGIESWVVQSLDAYDTRGLVYGIKVLQSAESFAQTLNEQQDNLLLHDVRNVLEKFIHGLNGRKLFIEGCESNHHTDTEKLFLPTTINELANPKENFLLLKAMAVHQWAQTWFGTWRLKNDESHSERLQSFTDIDKATHILHALETLRLDACITRELPGLAREIKAAFQNSYPNQTWQQAARILGDIDATVETSYALLPNLINVPLPQARPYQGTLDIAATEAVIKKRIEKQKQEFQRSVAQIAADAVSKDEKPNDSDQTETEKKRLRQKLENEQDGQNIEFDLDGNPVTLPQDIRDTLDSIIQDLGELPEDYLEPSTTGSDNAERASQEEGSTDAVRNIGDEDNVFMYDEWDNSRKHYRKKWCVLREKSVRPQLDNFVDHTLARHRGLVKTLQRTFEKLRSEEKRLKQQSFGEDLDIDTLVDAQADIKNGAEVTDRLYIHKDKVERNIAVMVMVDMSGSTKGWINEAIRESLVLLSESLETLGDRNAIYGFSGITRKRCDLYRIKRFNESYTTDVKTRISGIRPQDYTRMGVTIRHLSTLLNQIEARTKLLITLSDGRPDDYDQYYRGEYGIEDTRMALFEARHKGIHPFCITIDDEAQSYLPHMYGAANYIVINDVAKLPTRVSDIYRRLTS